MKIVPKPRRRTRRPRRCPIDGCPARIKKDQFMCKRHWARVPEELRERQVGLVYDLNLAFDDGAADFIIANLAINQRRCTQAAAITQGRSL